MTRYTVLREDGYYPDGSYDSKVVRLGVITSAIDRAKLWQHRKWAEKYVGKFGGKVIEVEVTYMRVS